ncbi:MAG: AAA family ATPase [Bacteroidales bacterium]|nr:AAA family ATPase [Bacteroidales bacterium]
MKLLKLEILNLASLDKPEGEVINFNEGALGDSNIFSIVGPTGSGKSTILDAICLALYDRTPRYSRQKGGRGRIEIYGEADDAEKNRLAPTDSRNILTRGKKFGYSKLTFLANNGTIYRAEWSVRFQVKKFASTITELYKISVDANGVQTEVLADWSELPKIIGLEYEQFLRTVLIAQGTFANFLTAKEDERYELLEKLIGCGEKYSRIADEIKRRKDASIANYQQISARFEAVKRNILNPEALEELKEQIAQLQRQQDEIQKMLKRVETELVWYDDDDKYQVEIDKCKEAVEAARRTLAAFQSQIARLNMHDAIEPAVNIMREVNRVNNEIANLKESIRKISDGIKLDEGQIDREKEALTKLRTDAENAQKTVEQTAPHIAKTRELKVKIEAAKSAFVNADAMKQSAEKEKVNIDNKIADNEKNINQTHNELLVAQDNLQTVRDKIDKKRAELNNNILRIDEMLTAERQKIDGQNIDELQQKKSAADAALNDMQNAKTLIVNIYSYRKEIDEITAKCDELSIENKRITEALSQLNIDALSKEKDVLQNTYTLLSSENWAAHRMHLEAGKPCPLCGATEHPYQADNKRFDDAKNDMQALLNAKTEELRRQQETEKQLSGQLSANKGTIAEKQKRRTQLQTDITNIETDLNSLRSKYPDLPQTQDEVDARIKLAESQQKIAAEALKFFIDTQKLINTYGNQKIEAQKNKDDFNERANNYVENESKKVEKLNADLTGYRKLVPTLQEQQNHAAEVLQNAITAWKKTDDERNELTRQYNVELGGASPEEVESRINSAKRVADEAVTTKEKQIANLREALSEKVGKHNISNERLNAENKQYSNKTKELAQWISTYNAKPDKLKEITADDVSFMLAATDDWALIRQQKENYTAAVKQNVALQEKAEQTLAEHRKSKPEKSKDALEAERDELQANNNIDALVNAKSMLDNHTKAEQELGNNLEAFQKAEQLKNDWEKISDAVGGSEGKLLRKIAQCNTLSFLIAHANTEIRKFNSRYELMQVHNSLGIRVIDHDRADDIRDTTSLSGGETFIVSLGLALGLSSLSSRNISFDNLFIDEGFGTLDPDMLATVIDSLSMLQSSQRKKVGVISHTDTMSERITTQIRIIKNGNSGSSRIEIYPS